MAHELGGSMTNLITGACGPRREGGVPGARRPRGEGAVRRSAREAVLEILEPVVDVLPPGLFLIELSLEHRFLPVQLRQALGVEVVGHGERIEFALVRLRCSAVPRASCRWRVRATDASWACSRADTLFCTSVSCWPTVAMRCSCICSRQSAPGRGCPPPTRPPCRPASRAPLARSWRIAGAAGVSSCPETTPATANTHDARRRQGTERSTRAHPVTSLVRVVHVACVPGPMACGVYRRKVPAISGRTAPGSAVRRRARPAVHGRAAAGRRARRP